MVSLFPFPRFQDPIPSPSLSLLPGSGSMEKSMVPDTGNEGSLFYPLPSPLI